LLKKREIVVIVFGREQKDFARLILSIRSIRKKVKLSNITVSLLEYAKYYSDAGKRIVSQIEAFEPPLFRETINAACIIVVS